MEITGVLLKKSEIKKISDSFSIQEFYLDCSTFNQVTGEKYENFIKIQLNNNKIEKLKPIQVGQRIKVSFKPTGRFYQKDNEKRHAQNLTAWDLSLLPTTESFTNPESLNSTEPVEVDNDDLPF